MKWTLEHVPFEDYVIININLSLNKILRRCKRKEGGGVASKEYKRKYVYFEFNNGRRRCAVQTLILNMVLHIYTLHGVHLISYKQSKILRKKQHS